MSRRTSAIGLVLAGLLTMAFFAFVARVADCSNACREGGQLVVPYALVAAGAGAVVCGGMLFARAAPRRAFATGLELAGVGAFAAVAAFHVLAPPSYWAAALGAAAVASGLLLHLRK